MLKLLLKKQLLEIFQVYFYDAKKNKARSKVSTSMYFVLFILLVFGLLGGIFTFLSAKLCTPLITVGMDWLYFALMGLLAVLLGAFGSVFNTYAGLYLPKDNDLLLSMPIPVSALVAARLFVVYLMGLLYSAIVILPAIIVYWMTTNITLPVVLGGLLITLLISVFVLTISCVLGWVVARISQKLKHKSLITVLVSLVIIGTYYFVYFKSLGMIQNLLVNAAVYGERIKGAAYPVYLFGSVGVGDVRASIIVFVAVTALFGLMWVLLSRSFLQITTSTGRVTRRGYREMRSRQRSIDTALLSREFSRFTASPNYMLNCGFGTFLMPFFALVVLWKGGALFGFRQRFLDMCITKPPVILLGVLYKFHSESQVINVYYAVTIRMETNRTIFDCIEGMGVLIGVERRKKSPSNCPLTKPGNRVSGSQAKLALKEKPS